jgi:CheY-like chemotaxis protein
MDEKQVPERIRSKTSEVVLLVDEEDMVRNLAHMILEASGYVVLEARDWREGLALCAGHQGPIDLLVTDLMFAELNGHEFAERAGKLRPGLKVMFMYERPEDIVLKEGMHAGSVFLQKPFAPVGLAEKVREALDSQAPALSNVNRS